MKLRTILFFIVTGTLFLCASSAFAVPYAVNFDPDADGTAFNTQTIWGWDLESVAEAQLPSGGATYDIITYQSLGSDNILNDDDTFTESTTVDVSNGLDSPLTSYSGIAPIYGELASPTANLFIDISLSGYVANYSNGGDGDTTASNAATNIGNDSYDSVFTGGNATMYVDTGTANKDYDSGETKVAEFSFSQGDDFSLDSSVFGGGSDTIGISFETTSMNTDYFSQASGFADPQDLIGSGFLFAVTQGSASLSSFEGDDSTDPDQIVIGFQETGFDAKFNQVPEPTTLLLFGTGLLGLAAFGRKKFIKKS